MLKRIGAEESGEFKAVASGTLPSGQPVVVNSDGTVSAVSGASSSLGSAVVFESAISNNIGGTFDSSNNRVIYAYRDVGNSSYGTAVVGTVSGDSISFGTPVVYNSGKSNYNGAAFDANAGKVVVAYQDNGNSDYGTAVVGTVDPSDNSISFGSEVVFESATINFVGVAYDANAQRIVIAYRDDGNSNYGTGIVGTVSGTSITFGTAATFESTGEITQGVGIAYESNAQKVVIGYAHDSNKGHAIVGTVDSSDNSISFGTATVFETETIVNPPAITFDSSNNKIVIAVRRSEEGRAYVGTVSGTSITFGSAVQITDGTTNNSRAPSAAFDTNLNKVIIAYGNSVNTDGAIISGTVSGDSISFDPQVTYSSNTIDFSTVVFDSNSNKSVVAFQDFGNSQYGTAKVFTPLSTNLTSENYIGMSKGGAVADTKGATVDIIGAIANLPNVYLDLSTASYENKSLDVSSQETSPTGLFFKPDGLSAYICGQAADSVFQYTLTSAWDVSTGSYASKTFDFSSQDTFPMGIFFKPDGTKMYMAGLLNEAIFQYSLSTAWDVSTASYDSTTYSLGSIGVRDVRFKPDGTKMYALGSAGDDALYQYSLSTAWDLSTTSYDSVTLPDLNDQEPTAVEGAAFNYDGTRVYIIGQGNDTVYQYNLTTGYDLSTGSYSGNSFSAQSQESTANGIYLRSDSEKFYIVGQNADTIFQYSGETGLTAGQQYFVQTDGTISTTAGSPSVLAGTAISATELLVKT
jgi:hypothetical protein